MIRARLHRLRGSFRMQRRYRAKKLALAAGGIKQAATGVVRRQWGLMRLSVRVARQDAWRVLAGPVRTT